MCYDLVIFLASILDHSLKMHLLLLSIVSKCFHLSAENEGVRKVAVV